MSTPDNGSYTSRFLVKFVEIIAAGLATAASGYLIAHLSATLSSSTPTNDRAVVATPNLGEKAAVPAQPATRSWADNAQQVVIPPQLTAPTVPQLTAPATPQAATTTTNVPKPEAPTRRIENTPKAASTRESWTVRVRAALANAAHRPDPPADSPHRSSPPAGVTEPRPVIDSNSKAMSAPMPAAAEVRAPPLQQTTIVASPPTVTEVNPAVPIQPSSAPPEKPPGALSTLEQMLRNDPLAGSEQAPRPPMPVGQE
jgi:hypothetical protein